MDGGHSFRPFGTNRSSCRGHVRLNPETSTLQPGERVDVRVWLDPVESECWAVLLVDEQTQAPKRGLRAGSQIAVKVYVTTPRSSFDADILSVTAENDSAGVHAVFEMRNLGTAPVRPNGRAEIRSLTGETLAAAEIEAFSILPGHTRRMNVRVNRRFASGSYLVVPILDFGGAFLAGGQGRLTIR